MIINRMRLPPCESDTFALGSALANKTRSCYNVDLERRIDLTSKEF